MPRPLPLLVALAALPAVTTTVGEAAGAAAAGASALLPFAATETTLPNDLRVIVVPTGMPDLVTLQIPVQTGSRNEVEPGRSGFAHFFEHMMFRGTERWPAAEYQAILTRAGARQNAYTSDDYTNYHVTFAKQDLAQILELEADRFQNLKYSEEDFKTEARAVLGEYNKNAASPVRQLIEVQRDHAFAAHTYKHTTMGFLRDIEQMPEQFEYSRTFFQRWYRPENTTLIVAGDVSADEVLPLVKRFWGGWEKGSASVEIPEEPQPEAGVYAHVPWPSPTQPWVTVAFHGPAFSEAEPDFAAVDLMMDLSFGPTSTLYQRLVEEEQLADQLFTYVPDNADPYLATVLARVKRPEDARAVRDRILEALQLLRKEAIPAEQLAQAKAHNRYAFLAALDSTESIGAALAGFVRHQRSYRTVERYYGVYDGLTPADLQAAARRYITDQRLVVTTLSHEPLDEALATTPPLDGFAPAAGPDGVETVEVPADVPQVVVKLLFRVGSAHDPEGKEGLAALAGSMIAEAGSRARRIDEIRQALYPMAGRFGAQVDREMTVFTASVHRDRWAEFSDVVLPMLLEPGLRQEDFTRLRDLQRAALELDLRANNEEELGRERLQELVYAGTAYGHTTLGNLAAIDALTLQDVRAFVSSMYTRANLVVGLSGRLPNGEKARLMAALEALPEGPKTAEPEGVVGLHPAGLEVEIVRKPTRATAISLGHPIAVTRSHPDFAALWLARAWLGEHRSSVGRLYQRLREERGLNYGDYAYIEAFPRGMYQFSPDANIARRAQLFEIWIRPVVPENAPMALRLALHELRGLIENGLDEAAFESTRAYVLKSTALLTSRQEDRLGYALDSRWYGIGEFTPWLRERIQALTREQVNDAIRRHLSAEDLFVVIVAEDA